MYRFKKRLLSIFKSKKAQVDTDSEPIPEWLIWLILAVILFLFFATVITRKIIEANKLT